MMECPVCGYDNMDVDIDSEAIRRYCPECGEYQYQSRCVLIPIQNNDQPLFQESEERQNNDKEKDV